MLAVSIAAMTLVQDWLILRSISRASAEIGSIYMRGIVVPHLSGLRAGQKLSETELTRLDDAIRTSGLGAVTREVKIWSPDGTVIYSTFRDTIGRRFDSTNVSRAAQGETVVNYGDHIELEHVTWRYSDGMVEIYVPIRDEQGHVYAVGEFYQDHAGAYDAAMRTIQDEWIIRAVFLIAGIGIVYILVRRADRIIRRQHHRLHRHLVRARRFAAENENLRQSAEEDRKNAIIEIEKLLSRVGADIHDGPMQLLSLLAVQGAGSPRDKKILNDVIVELRAISAGLILPDISDLSAEDAVRLATARHEQATGTAVATEISPLPPDLVKDLTATLYRIVQEALNNTARHADGMGQSLKVWCDNAMIYVVVEDKGPGLKSRGQDAQDGLGLVGIGNRVSANRGTYSFDDREGGGARLSVRLPIRLEPEARH